ncbi:hypothetical protein OCU04_010661 [Sclerotinia nivalis]|uniref:Zn(2)-C6 fungal-type domain-containing protein n=1 Tax=Sclerotinia nivalis TaxID=352851 RepID=A0A9X0ACN2_9HELO|nr:hypothetical protein OCU04_010661 [Sclerotinia nivalis]
MTSNTSRTPQMQNKSSKQSRNRTLLSCTECHRRKQKCNRKHPCNDCLERGVPHKCHFVPSLRRDLKYDHKSTGEARDRRILTGEEVLLSHESVADLRSARPCYASKPSLSSEFMGGFDAFSVLPGTTGDPLPKSTLIEYFIRRLGPWLGSFEDAPHVDCTAFTWLKIASHHPSLFYATLLGSVVHRGRKQPIDKRTLIWYKIETMRLANEAMNIPNEGATDQMLLVVLILLYFNVSFLIIVRVPG